MVQVKVEHVIVVLLGLFLLYHFMGSCGCNKVEGWVSMGYNDNQPWVSSTKYCGLSDDYKTYSDKEMGDIRDSITTLKESLDGAQTNYLKAEATYTFHKEHYENSVKDYESSSDYEDAEQILNSIDRHAELANSAIASMKANATLIGSLKTQIQTAIDDLTDKRNKRVAAADECSKPNRLLSRYKPQVACVGTVGDGNIDENKFSTLWVEDRNDFKKGVEKRQYNGKKNACAVLTANDKNVYPFNGLINDEDKSFAGLNYFNNLITGDVPDTPAYVPVASPLPSTIEQVGMDYVAKRAESSFDSEPTVI